MNTFNILFFTFIIFIIGGCKQEATFGFTSSNCNEVYTTCLNQCVQSQKKRTDCMSSCDKSRAMCEAVKTKGCMQNCNKNYGKNSQQSETCKQRCIANKGVSH